MYFSTLSIVVIFQILSISKLSFRITVKVFQVQGWLILILLTLMLYDFWTTFERNMWWKVCTCKLPVISWNTEANLGYGVTKPKFTKPRQSTPNHSIRQLLKKYRCVAHGQSFRFCLFVCKASRDQPAWPTLIKLAMYCTPSEPNHLVLWPYLLILKWINFNPFLCWHYVK